MAPVKGSSPDDAYLGGRIRVVRRALKVTQEVLAARIGISPQQLQKYEHGDNRISVSRLLMIARALQVPAAYLLGVLADERGEGQSPERAALLDRIDRLHREAVGRPGPAR